MNIFSENEVRISYRSLIFHLLVSTILFSNLLLLTDLNNQKCGNQVFNQIFNHLIIISILVILTLLYNLTD
jgi:uncharacterized membrane protein